MDLRRVVPDSVDENLVQVADYLCGHWLSQWTALWSVGNEVYHRLPKIYQLFEYLHDGVFGYFGHLLDEQEGNLIEFLH